MNLLCEMIFQAFLHVFFYIFAFFTPVKHPYFEISEMTTNRNTTELYYITGGHARHKKVKPRTWWILCHFHDNTSEIFMVTATDQPRS
jgi:hypothetical protein